MAAMSEACTEIQQVMRASLLELVSHLRDRLGISLTASHSVCGNQPCRSCVISWGRSTYATWWTSNSP